MRIEREISCYKQPGFRGEQVQQLNRFIQFRVHLSMTLEVRSVEVCHFSGTISCLARNGKTAEINSFFTHFSFL